MFKKRAYSTPHAPKTQMKIAKNPKILFWACGAGKPPPRPQTEIFENLYEFRIFFIP